MNQAERRRFLIDAFVAERADLQNIAVPSDTYGQQQLLRALFNTREPSLPSADILHVQDVYLRKRAEERGIMHFDAKEASAQAINAEETLEVGTEDAATSAAEHAKNSKIHPIRPHQFLWQGDITLLECDAIVNAANSGMTGCWVPGHTCIDNCIHSFAGVQLRWECAQLMAAQGHAEPTGQAKITAAYNLPCKQVIHTVGPIVNDRPTTEDRALLASCYESCYRLAQENGVQSLAFCCISTGLFAFPQKEAAHIALQTVTALQAHDNNPLDVIFNVFRDDDFDLYS